jgi:DNA-binding transcriptional MerR regulator
MSRDKDKAYLRAGELAQLAEVSTDTLRHYERKGLLAAPRRSLNGYREYPKSALGRVRLVRRALEIGFTLDELSRVLSVRDHGGAPCRQVRALAGEKLREVETRLAELVELRNELRKILIDWDEVLAKTSSSGRAELRESLAANTPPKRVRSSALIASLVNRKKKRKELQQ